MADEQSSVGTWTINDVSLGVAKEQPKQDDTVFEVKFDLTNKTDKIVIVKVVNLKLDRHGSKLQIRHKLDEQVVYLPGQQRVMTILSPPLALARDQIPSLQTFDFIIDVESVAVEEPEEEDEPEAAVVEEPVAAPEPVQRRWMPKKKLTGKPPPVKKKAVKKKKHK